jgi:hypothetical protein
MRFSKPRFRMTFRKTSFAHNSVRIGRRKTMFGLLIGTCRILFGSSAPRPLISLLSLSSPFFPRISERLVGLLHVSQLLSFSHDSGTCSRSCAVSRTLSDQVLLDYTTSLPLGRTSPPRAGHGGARVTCHGGCARSWRAGRRGRARKGRRDGDGASARCMWDEAACLPVVVWRWPASKES